MRRLIKKTPPDRDFGMKDLEAVATEAARLWPNMAPLGGSRWTREDIEWAVSLLYLESRTERFARARSRAKSREQARNYLLKSLRNQLFKRTKRGRRVVLLDPLDLESVRSTDPGRNRLDREDRNALVAKVIAHLSENERRSAMEMLRRGGPGAHATDDGRKPTPPKRTRTRHKATFLAVLQSAVTWAGLSRKETMDLLAALGTELAKREPP